MKTVCYLILLLALILAGTGCGSFMARSLASPPKRYPRWLAPTPPVTLNFNPKLLTNFVARYATVGPPTAKLCYRIVNPADYGFQITAANWFRKKDGRKDYAFAFKATVPAPANQWTISPRGTVFLLHGYGLAQFSMLPWALRLGQDGWRCVLVDLRAHGKSTGNRVFFSIKETDDMRQLLDTVQQSGQVTSPVSVVGDSLGGVLALRWKSADPRVTAVVAIAPYASFSNAVMNLHHEYANWVPNCLVRAGLKNLPSFLKIPADKFDATTFMRKKPVTALFIAGELDKIAPSHEVEKLKSLALPNSQYILIPGATHEGLPYYFPELTVPVENWLAATNNIGN